MSLFAKIISALVFLFCVSALAETSPTTTPATPTQAPIQTLTLAYPDHSTLNSPVTVQLSLEGKTLWADFTVKTPEIYAKPLLGPKEYPYQKDVVEVFVSVAGMDSEHLPYYEFELSPYDQTFEVKINDPHKRFIEGVHMGLLHSVKRSSMGWTARMGIPLANLHWDGNPAKIIGNAYSVLGQSPERSYWSLFLPREAKPNFHRPEFFQPLLRDENVK